MEWIGDHITPRFLMHVRKRIPMLAFLTFPLFLFVYDDVSLRFAQPTPITKLTRAASTTGRGLWTWDIGSAPRQPAAEGAIHLKTQGYLEVKRATPTAPLLAKFVCYRRGK